MKFNEYVKIDNHFQNSINIRLDLNDIEKINAYIPTTDSIDFFNHFIDNINFENGDHSTMLIAPYGKGKSHALLVLLSLLVLNDFKPINNLLNKFKSLDRQLFEKICDLQNKKFLPVIISNTRGSLNQSLMLALQRTLSENNINDIVLNSDFDQAIERIESWKKNYQDTYNSYIAKLKEFKISKSKFEDGLCNYDEKSMNQFKEIHKLILSGTDFIPNSNLEVTDYYLQVAKKIQDDYGYNGIYIIFDEFSKFLESRDSKTVSNDMKIIQDLAELCNNNKEANLFLQLVLHKPIKDYISISSDIRNAFEGIEGRVGKPYYFSTSTQSTFDLISSVLKKNDKYIKLKNQNKNLYKEIYDDIYQIPTFEVEFNQEHLDHLIDLVYPLHPLTAYIMVKVNEKVAQNERTLFTFLSKNTPCSIPNAIEQNCDSQLILPDLIFDYFENLLIEEKDDIQIAKVASSAISAIKLANTSEQVKLIKTLALLLIINEKDTLPTSFSILKSTLSFSKSQCENVIDSLLEKGIIVQRRGGIFQFKINMNLDVDNSINNLINTKLLKINITKELDNIIEDRYVYPRIYNFEHSMTRFFEAEFILEEDFLSLNKENIEAKFDDYKDGLILRIVRGMGNNYETVSQHVKEINLDRLVVVYPSQYVNYEIFIRRLRAIERLLGDDKFIDENKLIKSELELYQDDMKLQIIDSYNKGYGINSNQSQLINSYHEGVLNNKKSHLSKDRILKEILEEVFYKSPLINLELLNKWNVKSAYKTAREKVNKQLLDNTLSLENLGTSPDDTIVKCVVLKMDENVLNEIKNHFTTNGDFGTLYDKLIKKPYGMRKGPIPIYIGYILGKLSYDIIILNNGQEIELSSHTLELINDNPQNFSYVIDESSQEKDQYLNQLSKIFNCQLSESQIKNYELLANSIKKWFNSLPKFTKQMIGKADELKGRNYKKLNKYCLQQNINPSEFVMKSLAECCNNNLDELLQMKNTIDTYINLWYIKVKSSINLVLGYETNDNINQTTKIWYQEHINKLNKKVLDNAMNKFVFICKEDIDDEKLIINKIVHCFTTLFIEDWSLNTYELFEEQINKVKEFDEQDINDDSDNTVTLKIGEKTIIKSFNDDLDGTAEMLENILVGELDDFGDSLSNEQKLALLVKIMKKYI